METPNKEQVYDEQIYPLMAQIIEICEKHGIAFIADFSIPTPDNPDLAAATLVLDGDGNNAPGHLAAARILKMLF